MADPFATLSGNSPTRTVDIRVYFLVAVALLGLALWLTKKYWFDRPPPKNKQSTFYVPLSYYSGPSWRGISPSSDGLENTKLPDWQTSCKQSGVDKLLLNPAHITDPVKKFLVRAANTNIAGGDTPSPGRGPGHLAPACTFP